MISTSSSEPSSRRSSKPGTDLRSSWKTRCSRLSLQSIKPIRSWLETTKLTLQWSSLPGHQLIHPSARARWWGAPESCTAHRLFYQNDVHDAPMDQWRSYNMINVQNIIHDMSIRSLSGTQLESISSFPPTTRIRFFRHDKTGRMARMTRSGHWYRSFGPESEGFIQVSIWCQRCSEIGTWIYLGSEKRFR